MWELENHNLSLIISSPERLNSANYFAYCSTTGNWENFNVFGSPEGSTSADYKSRAYFSLSASDIMLWHVPNDVEIYRARDEASLIYHTNTAFLGEYGGTLQSLFHRYFPLTKRINPQGTSTALSVDGVLEKIQNRASFLKSMVPSFFSYTYDGGNQTINDGGSDMFDGGNKIFYQIGNNPKTQIVYNETYSDEDFGMKLMSVASHPFNLVMWIGNEERRTQSFALTVSGDAGADGSGSYDNFQGSITSGTFSLRYEAYGVHSASDPSICKVFYYISSSTFGSQAPTVRKEPWTSGTATLQHGLVFEGSPRSLLVGFTLLSKSSGQQVTNSEIRRVLSEILSVASASPVLGCNDSDTSLAMPVIFVKGNKAEVNAGIPPSQREDVEAGFVQFRPYNKDGIPNALCPAVRATKSCRPESVCIGGINTMSNNRSSCGDFAGWQGSSGDNPTKAVPDGSAKSLNDVNSAILIFTREHP